MGAGSVFEVVSRTNTYGCYPLAVPPLRHDPQRYSDYLDLVSHLAPACEKVSFCWGLIAERGLQALALGGLTA